MLTYSGLMTILSNETEMAPDHTSWEPELATSGLGISTFHGPVTYGTINADSYLSTLDYLWDNHTPSFSILRVYDRVKKYEDEYQMSSEDLVRKWSDGSLTARDSRINNWLTSYIQIKDFVK